ncbi:hypothetical protein BKA61DRAFT_618216 [Leptodontidium sp. MPI-SDFR-AT-0119]|nr:hypothetical protein BKA61DRAFT_618216 [Leptodontidium sp. MPI-SDFR-AT-0119]
MENTLAQYASTASLETLFSHFAQVAKHDQERSEFTHGVLKRLESYELEIHTLKMDLEDQSNSRKRYQLRASNLEDQKRKMEQIIDKDPYVVVLIDGDGSKFLDELLRDPVSGAAEAAQRLRQKIKDYLMDTPLGAMDVPILVRVFANLNDLARSLRFSNVIESADDMRTFAENFTNSRAEFDFVNVGRGKENADSKMRKMFSHFLKNYQCKKIFFAGCHDNGYLHDLREHVGDPNAKDRIVLVETTAAEPGFLNLGFPMIRLDTVFRSEPLGNERKNKPEIFRTRQSSESLDTATPPDITSTPSPSLSASKTATSAPPSVPTASFSTSGNGGTSIKYPSSYATAGGSGHQNIVVQTAKSKNPKTIEYNELGHRLDPPVQVPLKTNPSQASYKAKLDRIRPSSFCNNFYLAGKCKWGSDCDRDHGTKLTPGEIAIHRYRARTSPCPSGADCDDYDCPLSHHCLNDPHCTRPDCKFKTSRNGDLHLSQEELVPRSRWTEGIDFPTAL